ncbi:hypothetical protein GCM10020221_26830 [Streptomyces thioluteus]|uniref:FAD-binding domain-containing protein n=1 Tax=Streptomyces thioluteus TaxID=66431 RepID=A0ABN3WVR0_STRTU
MGDAAHAVVPFFGQGINCSFEDAATAVRATGERPIGGPLRDGAVMENIVEKYSGTRVAAGHALAELSLRNLQELSAHVTSPSFHERRALERRLHEQYPDCTPHCTSWWHSPARLMTSHSKRTAG